MYIYIERESDEVHIDINTYQKLSVYKPKPFASIQGNVYPPVMHVLQPASFGLC